MENEDLKHLSTKTIEELMAEEEASRIDPEEDIFPQTTDDVRDMEKQDKFHFILNTKKNRKMYWDEWKENDEIAKRSFYLVGGKFLEVSGCVPFRLSSEVFMLFNEHFVKHPDKFYYVRIGSNSYRVSIPLRELGNELPVVVYDGKGSLILYQADQIPCSVWSAGIDNTLPKKAVEGKPKDKPIRTVPEVNSVHVAEGVSQYAIDCAVAFLMHDYYEVATSLKEGKSHNIRSTYVKL